MVQSFPKGLKITAVAAKDLANKKFFGQQDPYLAFFIQKLLKFTAVAVKGGITPSWNQTKTFNQIYDGTQEETTLKISCYHERTGVKGSSDGLIGTCDVELKEVLFSSADGIFNGWLQLTKDGVKTGQVHLKLWLCDPIMEKDESEASPLREGVSRARQLLKDRSERKAEKKKVIGLLQLSKTNPAKTTIQSTDSTTTSSKTADTANANNTDQPPGEPSGNLQRSPTNRLQRPRSLVDVKERKQTITFQEPLNRRAASKSMEDVRAALAVTYSSEEDDYDDEEEEREQEEDDDDYDDDYDDDDLESIGSPRPRFTFQDGEGRINPLNLLIAPFDPNWLEPTPQILKRALTAQFYYDDLHIQQTSDPNDLFPRPQRLRGYPGDSLYTGNGHLPASFQTFNSPGAGTGGGSSRPTSRIERPLSIPMPIPEHHIPPRQQKQQQQPQQQQQQQQPEQQHTRPKNYPQQSIPPVLGTPTSMPLALPTHMPTPQLPNRRASQVHSGPIQYQPQTVFQPRQGPKPKPAENGDANQKFKTMPARYQAPQATSGPISVQAAVTSSSSIPATVAPTLGPAAGYLPETYSQEHQHSLSMQLAQLLAPTSSATTPIATSAAISAPSFAQFQAPSRSNTFKIPGALPEESELPGTQAWFYPAQGTVPVQPSTPVTGGMLFASPMSVEKQIFSPRKPSSRTNLTQRSASTMSQYDTFSTMLQPPATPVATKVPENAKESIFAQYTPRGIPWDGQDIQDSLPDKTLGRRILSRYSLGASREKYVREGLFVRDKSPSFDDSQTQQQQQQQQQLQHRGSTRHNTMDKEANDRVILKYIKSKREWEVDSAMMRYLSCHHPEEKLQSQYMDYPQPQQSSLNVSPFVVGLYETFYYPHGTDKDSGGAPRYLSILQWFPRTLQGFITECTAKASGLHVTLPVIRSLIECVTWIHSRKICHLNIKPSNFVRDPYSTSTVSQSLGTGWKLVDFEAARVIDEEIVGRCTFSYAAPEILIGNSTMTGVIARGAQDIWSLGLVIYELLTDQPLFLTDAKAKDTLVPNIRTMRPVRYYDHKNVPPEYVPLLDSMLTHDPALRATAAQLLQLDVFTMPISDRPMRTDQMVQNNNILTLRDLKPVRLCNFKSGSSGYGGQFHERDGSKSTDGANNSSGSLDSFYATPGPSQQQLLMEGISRVLDSQFDQAPRLFMLLPPMAHDLDPTRPFLASSILHNKSLRLVLLCEGLSGYGEDAHFTDHRGYLLQDPVSFVREAGKMLLHLVAVAGTNSPVLETPGLDRPLMLTGTPLDNCQRWYPSMRSYYEMLQKCVQQELGPPPSLNELLSLRGPTLRQLENWLIRSMRQQSPPASGDSTPTPASIGRGTGSSRSINVPKKRVSMVAASDTISHAGLPLGGMGYDDLSDHLAALNFEQEEAPGSGSVSSWSSTITAVGGGDILEVTGPGGGEGFGGLFKMPVGTCGDRWICRGCVSKQMSLAAASSSVAAVVSGPIIPRAV
ncbi:regulator of ime2 [Gryganskiella cystojenkinii]|nr:regulator of ime2 [Gryganskiella cystojenkinii]